MADITVISGGMIRLSGGDAMCQQCTADTKLGGLKKLEGLCIRCWRDKAEGIQQLLDAIEQLENRYGDNRRIAPDSILRIFEMAHQVRGRRGEDGSKHSEAPSRA